MWVSWLVGMAAVGKILRYRMILKKTPPCSARTFARERSHGLTGSGGSYAVLCISLGRVAMPCLELSPSSPRRPQTIPNSKTDLADRFWKTFRIPGPKLAWTFRSCVSPMWNLSYPSASAAESLKSASWHEFFSWTPLKSLKAMWRSCGM